MDAGLLSIDRALQHLRTAPEPPEVRGMPLEDLARSPAASTVARLAAEREILVAHFEHRAHRVLPAAWVVEGEEGAAPAWQDGVLAEGKYATFRHDVLVASFHPGHRPKWSAHELCHVLVGFAWAPDRSPLWHATAGRLAELVPTVLWYFLDEVGLRRCPRHRGPTFRVGCASCNRAAARGRAPFDEDVAARWIADADRFVAGELAAVHDTLRSGTPRANAWGPLDLCSDGIAYARSHLPRLRSIEMALWADRFSDGTSGVTHASLASLEARAVAVLRAVAEGAPLDGAGEAARWSAMDLASRILEVHADTEGDARTELVALVDLLAQGEPPAEAIRRYAALCEDFVLPPPEEVAAVGYDLPGVPSRSVAQIEEGLRTVVPVTMTAIDDAGVDLVPRFVATDGPVREPLGIRFAAWLTERAPSPLADLARWEAALRAASGEPDAVALGPGDGPRLAEGVRLVESSVDVDELAEAVERGDVMATAKEGWPVLDAPPNASAHLVGRDGRGSLVVAELPPDLARSLRDDPDSIPTEVRTDLTRLGLLVPTRWPV